MWGEISSYRNMTDTSLDAFMEVILCLGRLRCCHLVPIQDVLDDEVGSSCITVSCTWCEEQSLAEYCKACIDICEPPDPTFVEDLFCQLVALADYLVENVPEEWQYDVFTRLFCLSRIYVTRIGRIVFRFCFRNWADPGNYSTFLTILPMLTELGIETDNAPLDVSSRASFCTDTVPWIVAATVFSVALSGPYLEAYSLDRRDNYSALVSFTKLPKVVVQEICLAMEHNFAERTSLLELKAITIVKERYKQLCSHLYMSDFPQKHKTQLIEAATNDDVCSVFLRRLFDVGVKTDRGTTALMEAVTNGNYHSCYALAACEAGYVDMYGCCATEHALLSGRLELVRTLLPLERLVLSFAGYTELMFHIMRYDYGSDYFHSNERHNLLQSLVDSHHLRLTHRNLTALMIAVMVGDLQAVQLLVSIESGLRDLDGLAAINYAIRFNNQDAYRILAPLETISDDSGNTPLHELAYHDRYKSLGLFHRFLGRLNCQSMSALMLAARCNNVESVRYLAKYEAGMRMHSRVFYGRSFENATAMMIAAYHGYREVVQILLPYEARYRDTHSFKTALMAAAMGGHPHVVHCLLEEEGGMANKSGYTALILAAIHNKPECVAALAIREAGMRSKNGELAIELAIKKGHIDVITRLLPYERVTAAHAEKILHTCSLSDEQKRNIIDSLVSS
ncbi:Protein 21.1 [Giardia lamblia P15]|uniref:Protein 21.1 n=1 Tax=Giardia intestinalis (strain P15) TaxID=658858 RepID=E1F1V4_GIAIA|nr:Protein 21.1 [Giardia lamblia P15]